MKEYRMEKKPIGSSLKRGASRRAILMGLGMSVVLSALAGCKSSSTSGNQSTSVPYNPPVGAIDLGKFYVRVYDENKFKYYMESDQTYGTECAIAYGSDAKAINCDLRIREGDLHYYGLKLQANIPTGMCTYAARMPYYYYNWQAGSVTGNVIINLQTNTCTGSDSLGDNTPTFSGGSCVFDTWTANADGTATSRFDHSAVNGPNCAQGGYSITTVAADGSQSSHSGKFGGRFGNCLAGPPISGMTVNGQAWPLADNGYPVGLINDVSQTGFNEVWEIQSAMSLRRSSSVRIANGYNYQYQFRGGARVHTSASNGYLPEAIYPAAYPGPPSTYPYYSWICMDEAFEVKYAIALYIHEFNTSSEFTAYGTSGGAKGASGADPDISGVESATPAATDCKYMSGHGFVCNDYWDWDDYPTPATALSSGTAYPSEL